MGFGEALQQKSVCVLAFNGRKAQISKVDIPCFQRLRQLSGSLSTLQSGLQSLLADALPTWVEVNYTGEDILPDLREKLEHALVEDEHDLISLLRVKNQRFTGHALTDEGTEQTLDDLSPQDVFSRCLAVNRVPDEQRAELLHLYQEILTQLQEADIKAE
jgi:exonuclease SbcD